MSQDATAELKAGRELDALVHSKVMGISWDESRCRVCGWPLAPEWKSGCVVGNCSMRYRTHHGRADDPPAYSENIALAWQVVERMETFGKFGYSCVIGTNALSNGQQRGVKFYPAIQGAGHSIFDADPHDGADAVSDSVPEAICIAALRTIAASTPSENPSLLGTTQENAEW
jgi:hypothetical protein